MSKVSSDWLIGAEFECCVRHDKYNSFFKKIRSLNKVVIFDEDGSIQCNDREHPVEFKSPPLPSKDAKSLISGCFSAMQEFGVRTNNSCGFHVNFSPVSDKLYYSINPIFLIGNPLWGKICSKFKRDRNTFCLPLRKTDPVVKFAQSLKRAKDFKIVISKEDVLKSVMGGYDIEEIAIEAIRRHKTLKSTPYIDDCDKYSALNIGNWTSKRYKDSRLELRAMGNTDYHLREKDVFSCIDEAIKVFNKCH